MRFKAAHKNEAQGGPGFSFTLGTGAIGAGLTGGVQGNRANATVRRTRVRGLSSGCRIGAP